MSTTAVAPRSSRASLGTLGSLWILYGILRLAAVLIMILYSPTATVMFGALLSRVADPFTLMAIFHVLYIVASCVTALSGVFGILAGLAMFGGRGSARGLALVASFFSLSDLPLGTTLGIYTLIIFLA